VFVDDLYMDPLAMAAEIAAILQAAQALPSAGGRRASRAERMEAYLAYQHEAYRLMAGVNHLSFLAQVKTVSWRTTVAAVVPMIGPFAEFALPTEPSRRPFIRSLQEMMKNITFLTNASSPSALSVLAAAYASDTQLRDRTIVDIAAVRDITADYLAALAKLRLVGRPCAVAAANVLLTLLQNLFGRIPTRDDRPLYLRVLFKSGKAEVSPITSFADGLAALGEANGQFVSAIRSDYLTRKHRWQVWRPRTCHIRSAKELLGESGERSNAVVDVARRTEPSNP
jgi:hypothetical protein